MSKHQKIMSFESSLDEINPKESESLLLEHTQPVSDRLFGVKDIHAQQDDSVLREVTRIHEDDDIGQEGNKSTYLRPSRNRDMTSLELRCNSRSVSQGGQQEDTLRECNQVKVSQTVETLNREPSLETVEILHKAKL